MAIHQWGWTVTLRPDGTTTARSPDGTKVFCLSIARSVVTAHRATVTARSQPAGGLDISVVIPRASAAQSQP